MTKLTQTSWLGGQMDVRMTGRQDMRNYRNGASVLKNFVPVKLGSIRKRPGTDFVADLTEWIGTRAFRMIPYGFLSGEGFVLVIRAGAEGTDEATEARAYAANELNGAGENYVEVEGAIPYGRGELNQICYVQCGDVVYLAHRGHPPAVIKHNLDGETHSFSYSSVNFNPITVKPTIPGSVNCERLYFENSSFTRRYQDIIDACKAQGAPFSTNPIFNTQYTEAVEHAIPGGSTTVSYKASFVVDGSEGPLSNACTCTFDSPWTESQTVTVGVTGKSGDFPAKAKKIVVRLYKEIGGVYGLIGEKDYAIGKKGPTFIDDNIAPDTSVTPIDDSDGTPFSKADDYPGSVGLYQQRLVWAGSNENPARIWMSRAGDLYEYRPHVKLQLDDAIDFILPITQFANINFIVELGRLFVFSECAELVVGSASDSQGISYETIMATEHSHLGCTKRLPPIVANNTLLFVNRTGQSVRDYDERIGSSRFGGTDVSVFSSSIFAENPIVDWTWQQEPNSTVWCVLKNGLLASFTYDKEQEIGAWATHELGGGGKALGIAKTCAVFGRDAAHPTTGEVMVVVERGEGADRRVTLERMRPWGAADGNEADRLCMDCCTDDASKSVAGMTVVNIDGVSHFGYQFESVMTTMPPVIGSEGGASQFDVKLGQHAHLRTVGSKGGEIYAVGMRNQPAKIDEGAVRDGEDSAEFCDVDVVLAGSNNRDGRVTVRHDGPWPFQLALLELDYEVEN